MNQIFIYSLQDNLLPRPADSQRCVVLPFLCLLRPLLLFFDVYTMFNTIATLRETVAAIVVKLSEYTGKGSKIILLYSPGGSTLQCSSGPGITFSVLCGVSAAPMIALARDKAEKNDVGILSKLALNFDLSMSKL